jgi:hypothetical protein
MKPMRKAIFFVDGGTLEAIGKLPVWQADERRREWPRPTASSWEQPTSDHVISMLNDRLAETEGLIERLFDLAQEEQRKLGARLARIEALLRGEE